jgi:hypothetical protein
MRTEVGLRSEYIFIIVTRRLLAIPRINIGHSHTNTDVKSIAHSHTHILKKIIAHTHIQ